MTKRKIRVLITSPSMDITNSANRHILAIAKYLPREDFSLSVCFLRSSDDKSCTDQLDELGVPHFRARFRVKQLKKVRAFWVAQQRMQEHGPFDIQHSFDFTSLPVEAFMARLYGRRYIYQQRNLSEGGAYFLHRLKYALTNHIIANSHNSEAHLSEIYNLDASRVSVIPSGIETNDIDRWEHDAAEEDPYILTIGHLQTRKRHQDAIRALGAVRDAFPRLSLKIAGGTYDQDYADSLQALITELGLESRVHLLGTRPDVSQLLSKASLFVLCSESDAFPRSIIEAMAVGTPIIASGIHGNRELIEDGMNGVIVPVEDIDGYAAAFRKILSDAAVARRFSEAGRQIAQDKYSAERMIHDITDVYRQVVSK